MEAGADFPISRALGLRVGGRHLRPFDDDDEALMGEPLRYTGASIGLHYRVAW